MANHDIVVMGASYGGLAAYTKLLSLLPRDFHASIFVVLHISPRFPSYLEQILSGKVKLRVLQPKGGEKPEQGTVYVAPPNHHLLLKEDHIAIVKGPRENLARPSIDVMFRSAAVACKSRVIAVLLTGLLDDGVSGLAAVKRCGGITIVQDPAEAEAPDMPNTAIKHAPVDHILSLEEIAAKLQEIVGRPAEEPSPIPEELMDEVKLSEHEVPELDEMEKIGDLTPFTCPECGGAMWSVKDEPFARFLCHTGHSFTTQAYIAEQSKLIENSLWSAVRFMQERAKVLEKMIVNDKENGRTGSVKEYDTKIRELKHHARTIRGFIASGQWNMEPENEKREKRKPVSEKLS